MRIVLLTTNLARGGAETQVAMLAARLSARGHTVTVVSLVRPTAFEAELRSAGARVFAPPLVRLLCTIRRLRPHVLHCHLFHANIIGRLLRLLAPIPVVISTLHSEAETGRRSRRIGGRDLLYRVTDALADANAGVSRAVVRSHVERGAIFTGRVVPNGVDTALFHPADERPPGEFTWLAAGRLMWKKNYPLMFAAFAALGRGVLLIAGAGPDEQELRQAAPPGVVFLGERTDLPDLMRRADGFVLSSSVEGLPMVLLEAAACGLPCVATDVGGIRESGLADVVPPGDAVALAQAMAAIMDLPAAERRAKGLAGRARVCQEFDLAHITSMWEELYRELWT